MTTWAFYDPEAMAAIVRKDCRRQADYDLDTDPELHFWSPQLRCSQSVTRTPENATSHFFRLNYFTDNPGGHWCHDAGDSLNVTTMPTSSGPTLAVAR